MPSHGAKLMKRFFALSAVLAVGAGLFAVLFFGLLETNTGKELEVVEHEFHSSVDQDTLPMKAPVTGIGYQHVPEN